MKKVLSTVFVVFVLLAITATSVLAAPLAETKTVTLVKVMYQQGGIALIFETSGLTNADLRNNNWYVVDGAEHELKSCRFQDKSDRVRCDLPKPLAGHGEFRVGLAGFVFSGQLPEASSCGEGNEIWYAFDTYFNGELDGYGLVPSVVFPYLIEWAQDNYKETGELYEFRITESFCVPIFEGHDF